MTTRIATSLKLSVDNSEDVGGELNLHRESIDVSQDTETTPDQSWQYVDRAGHYHAWTSDGDLPTLKADYEHRECDGGHFGDDDPCEGYDVRVYACLICGEQIEPAVNTTHGERRFAPGMEQWSAEVRKALTVGQRVSLVARHVDGLTLFGVGVVTATEYDAAIGPASTIRGVGQLGRRG